MELTDEYRRCVSDGAVDGATACVAVASSAESFRDFGDIDRTFAAEVEAKAIPIRKLAKEECRAHAEDADEVVDDALAVFDDRVGAFHVIERDVGPGDLAVDLEVGERSSEESNLALRVREVDGLSDARGVGATLQQMLREPPDDDLPF